MACSCHGVGRGGVASIYKAHLIEAAVFVQISTYLFGTSSHQRWFAEGGCAWAAPPTPHSSPCVPGESPGPKCRGFLPLRLTLLKTFDDEGAELAPSTPSPPIFCATNLFRRSGGIPNSLAALSIVRFDSARALSVLTDDLDTPSGIPIPISQPAPQNPLVSLPGRSSL